MGAVPQIKEALREALELWDADRPYTGGGVHPTDLAVALSGGDQKCPRAIWLRGQGADKRPPHAGELLMWYQGHKLEREVFDLIAGTLVLEGWRVIAANRSVRHTLPEGLDEGELDRLLEGPNGERIVVDVKSVRGRAMEFIRRGGAKPANVMQIRTYMMAEDADAGMLVYVDREGQNFVEEFEVERDDAAVLAAIPVARTALDAEEAPAVMAAKVTLKINKGPDSVYVALPWQCDYCPFLDVSCPGAVPRELRSGGVVGHIKSGGGFMPRPGSEGLTELVEADLAASLLALAAGAPE